MDRAAFRAALLAWYQTAARKLPWRQQPSLYRTVVSEFMLQQTQVKTVLPYFERWMRRFPDFAALAAAPVEDVVNAWEGLGYYTRARNLHRLAQALVARPDLPQTPEAWRELPGIGPYTAAAITSIAFGRPAACVDGNVVRIIARLRADGTEFRDSASAAKALTPVAESWMEGCDRPGDYNQAMMELGATLCTRAAPQCLICPVRGFCAAGQGGEPARYPRLAAKTITAEEVIRVWCVREGALLLHRNGGDSRRLAGLHELPTAAQAGIDVREALAGRLLARKRRSITRFRIDEAIYAPPSPPPAVGEAGTDADHLVWVPLADLPACTLSGPHRRWVGELLAKKSFAP